MEFLSEEDVTTVIGFNKDAKNPDEEIIWGVKTIILLEEIIWKIDMPKLFLLMRAEKINLYSLENWDLPVGRRAILYPLKARDLIEGDLSLYDDFWFKDVWLEKHDAIRLMQQIGLANNEEQTPQPKPDAQTDTVDRIPVKDFVKSLRDDVLKFWDVVKPGNSTDAYQSAVEFLEQNPGMKITVKDVHQDDFRFVEKPKRAVLGTIIQRILNANGYKCLGQNKIEELLK